MAKTILLDNWVSTISNKMFTKWIRRGVLPEDTTSIGVGKPGSKSKWVYKMKKDSLIKYPYSMSVIRRLKHQGFKEVNKTWVMPEGKYNKLRDDVNKWYGKIFAYVTDWLTVNDYIKLKKGSFAGGFCAETDPKIDAVKSWGAPLVANHNKVVQIKEKFGDVVVYFCGITKKDRKKIDTFAKHVERKFDCITRFC